MQGAISNADLFLHVRVVMGMVVGLGMARLLTGLAYFVQHPSKHRVSLIHLGWAAFMLLLLVHFWWWEFWLSALPRWDFKILLFLLCTLLFPDDIDEYAGYEQFFLARRQWFFGILGLSFGFDFVDTLLKGANHLASFGVEYKISLVAHMLLCAIAMAIRDRRFHLAFVAAALIYQVSFILRLFDSLG
jgi:MFS superfamily sulfate permease-like transporter